MAIKEILSNPENYGFQFEEEDLYVQVPTFEVQVDSAVSSWADFAKQYDLSYKVLKRHNPWLRQPHLDNSSGKSYVIEIPKKGYYRSGS